MKNVRYELYNSTGQIIVLTKIPVEGYIKEQVATNTWWSMNEVRNVHSFFIKHE